MFNFILDTYAILALELSKSKRDPFSLFVRVIQPILWLTIFGQTFNQVSKMHTGNINYLTYITPGILAQSILFSGIFYGIAIIWEKDLGILHKLLVSPVNRTSLILGKALTAGFRSCIQGLVIYLVAYCLNVTLKFEFLACLGVFSSMMLGAATFSTFSLIIACLVKTRERFMGIGQILTMPLFFASNAIYPIEIMPQWLQVIAKINPLTYLVDSLRGLLIVGGETHYNFGTNMLVLSLIFLSLLFIATKLYPTLVR